MAKKKIKNSKRLVYTGLLLAGAGVGAYALLNHKYDASALTVPVIVTPSTKRVAAVKVKRQYRPDAFPLQKGMQGATVGQMQVALKAIGKLGISFQADGKFGPLTENTLTALGFPTVVTEDVFNAIKAKSVAVTAPIGETKYQKLQRWGYNAASEIEPAVQLNQAMTSSVIPDSSVKSLLSGSNKTITNIQRAYNALTGKNLVNDLLSLSLARVRFNEQITRLQALSGLEGIPAKPASIEIGGPRLITTATTLIKEKGGAFHKVAANTVLGTRVYASGGAVWFREKNGHVMKAPAGDVRVQGK